MHEVQLFVGPLSVLARYRAHVPSVAICALEPSASLAVLPFDDDTQDALHRQYGTGEWSDVGGLQLSSRDMAFATDVSRAGPLAYIQTYYHDDAGGQAACLWSGGALLLGPVAIARDVQAQRPASFWPINAALRGLGLIAAPGWDEFATLGLQRWTTTAAIRDAARRLL